MVGQVISEPETTSKLEWRDAPNMKVVLTGKLDAE
jgi:hypothetical protein